ncbi:MAG: enoyl-[acyl-carrier-protein] reductase FabK [Syntrophothermus sp.]|uniref:enoyl-[acyl-carrier-protein] reductase FabK n=1 Tax=Syntrophothermus sp. TaxID=2736299 RepID=UPI00257A4D61|nr:enoyl-[acyl-carrier-protein] reductase FabK [Syntrophothermus sp.]NSW81983.1 enoyl-[acyl-carrier-protein] reductase FabK [Syntrophothermus sp.]
MLRTRVTELLGIKYPLFQGGMAWIATGQLAGAVSKAGGLGIIGVGGADSRWLKKEIETVRGITDKPFGVNLILTSPYIEENVKTVIQEKVPVVTTGAGNPGKYISSLKDQGIKVIPVVASVPLAKRLVRLGADAVIAEGMESGGHIGEMTTMCLVPMVVDAVDVPVIAAGGIADGRGFAAVLALGAEGVQMGTRFICAEECPAHPRYKEKVLKAKDRDTVACGLSTGHPVRAIYNQFIRYYLAREKEGLSPQELDELASGKYPAAALEGDTDNGTVLAGQIAGLVHKIQPAEEIVLEVMEQAESVLRKMGGYLCSD